MGEVTWPGESQAAGPAGSQTIRESESWLASRLPGIPVWYGRVTGDWWAVTGGRLVNAPTARELATLLSAPPAAIIRRRRS
jgi:hypothetical protein